MKHDGESLRVLVVDDEPLARELLTEMLASIPRVEVVGRCEDGMSAVEEIGNLRPDLVLLDVQMPGFDGFDVLERVGPGAMPEVVFVTAHEEHAVRAFQVHALDYVLKPVDRERLRDAVQRAFHRVFRSSEATLAEQLQGVLDSLVTGGGLNEPPPPRRITVHKGDAIRFIEVSKLAWLEAARNYVVLHADDDTFLLRSTLKDLLRSLHRGPFVRIHRSAAVNLDKVDAVRPLPGGDYAVWLHGGEKLRASRTYAEELLQRIHRS